MKYFWKLLLMPLIAKASANVVTNIDIEGNSKISKETISKYLPIELGDDVDTNEKNETLKSLYKSGLFKDVSLKETNGNITVSVQEAPIINKISFEGNKKIKDDDIKKACLLKENEVLNLIKVKNIQISLLEAYRNIGLYNATINPKIIKLGNNKVNLIFEINEGQKARISKIMFIGNKHISSTELRREMFSKQKSWYKFMSNDDLYDPNKLEMDKSLIINCYKKRGFAQMSITAVDTELDLEKKRFIITFHINEGEKFKFGKITKTSKIAKLDIKNIRLKEYCKPGDDFNLALLNMDISNINKAISKMGFLAVDIRPEYSYNLENKTININLNIIETKRKYISKIIINGNTKTRNYVILRELPFEEGDIYSPVLISKAETNLKQTGFFKNVVIHKIPDPLSPDKCIVEINVEDEQKSGRIQFSAAYSTLDGPTGSLAYYESNFLGYGKSLYCALSGGRELHDSDIKIDEEGVAERVKKGELHQKKFNPLRTLNIKISDPKFLGKDIDASIGVFKGISSQFDSFFTRNYGISTEETHALSKNISQSFEITGTHNKCAWMEKNLSPVIASQLVEIQNDKLQFNKYKKYNQLTVSHDISYKNSIYKGILNGGYKLGLNTTFGLNDKNNASFMRNMLYGVYAKPLFNNNSFIKLSLNFGNIIALNKKDINIVDSFTNTDNIRGFETGNGCPQFVSIRRRFNPITNEWKNTLWIDTAGAKNSFTGSLSYSFPLSILPEILNARMSIFTDFGKYWNAIGPKNVFTKTKYTVEEFDKANTFLKNKSVGIVSVTGTEDEIIEKKYHDNKLKLDKCICEYESVDDVDPLIAHKTYEPKGLIASIGVEFSFDTPVGPLSFYLAKSIKKGIFDRNRVFGLSISQSF